MPIFLKIGILNFCHNYILSFYLFADFIIRLDQTCGPLTLHSSVKELVKYTQQGLGYLSKEKEDAAANNENGAAAATGSISKNGSNSL